jgi:hypothetical protein
MSRSELVLVHATAPALVFASDPARDGVDVLDLRATDLPLDDVVVRAEVLRRWRAQATLVVRIDEAPTRQVQALLLELSRREVRLTSVQVERFDDAHRVVVRTAAKAPPAAVTMWFPIRVRAAPVTTSASTSTSTSPRTTQAKPTASTTPPRRTHAGQR